MLFKHKITMLIGLFLFISHYTYTMEPEVDQLTIKKLEELYEVTSSIAHIIGNTNSLTPIVTLEKFEKISNESLLQKIQKAYSAEHPAKQKIENLLKKLSQAQHLIYNHLLIEGAYTGKPYEKLKRLLELGADPNARNSEGLTAFDFLLHNKYFFHINTTKKEMLLLDAGVDLHYTTPDGYTILHKAAYNNDVDLCAELVNRIKKIDPLFATAKTLLTIHKKKKQNNEMWLPKPILFLILKQLKNSQEPQKNIPLFYMLEKKVVGKPNDRYNGKIALELINKRETRTYLTEDAKKLSTLPKELFIQSTDPQDSEKIKKLIDPKSYPIY